MTPRTAEQFAYMPAAIGSRRGYQVVGKSPGISDAILAQMEPYMLPAGAGRGFSSSKSLLLLRGHLVAYSSVTNVGDGYDGRPDALYNHTLVLSEEGFAGVGYDTRALDAHFARDPPRGALPRVRVEGGAPAPFVQERHRHLVLPVMRALFAGKKVALSEVNDPSFLPNVLAMLPPSMRLVPFSTCLPDPKRQPAYRLATYEGRMRTLPKGFADVSKPGRGSAGRRLDDALLFLAKRAESGSAGEVFSEFDQTSSPDQRAKIVMLSKVFGVPDSLENLRAGRARDALGALRGFDQETQSRLMPRLGPFLDEEPPRGPVLPDAGEKFTAKSITKLLDGVPAANKRRALEAAYGARGRDLGRNAGSLLADLHGSPHARDVCGFFAATAGLHPGMLEFLSGRTHATHKHRRRVLDLLLPAALKECPRLVPDLFACGVLNWQSKDDARDLLRMLGTVAESGAGSDLLADALASALGRGPPGRAAG